MKRKLKIMTWMLVGSTLAANGQSITPEVVATAGNHFSNGTTQLSWTLGEVMINTYSSSGNMLTQGFHQTQLTVTDIEESNQLSFDVNVYPNPTTEILNISIEGKHGELTTTIYDIRGKMVLSKAIRSNEMLFKLNLQLLAMGQYVLRISEKGSFISSHQIIKASE